MGQQEAGYKGLYPEAPEGLTAGERGIWEMGYASCREREAEPREAAAQAQAQEVYQWAQDTIADLAKGGRQ